MCHFHQNWELLRFESRKTKAYRKVFRCTVWQQSNGNRTNRHTTAASHRHGEGFSASPSHRLHPPSWRSPKHEQASQACLWPGTFTCCTALHLPYRWLRSAKHALAAWLFTHPCSVIPFGFYMLYFHRRETHDYMERFVRFTSSGKYPIYFH